MKKNGFLTKRVIAFLLAAVMVLPLAACGDDSSNSGDGNTQSETPTANPSSDDQNTSDDANEPDEPAASEYDFGGRVVRIGCYYDLTPDPEANSIEAALAERIAFVEENYNCKIEFLTIEGDFISEYVTSVLAGDPICDIAYARTRDVVPSLIEGGIAYPVSDLGVFDFDAYKWRQDVSDAGTYKGKTYCWLLKDPEIRYGIFWNKTLFEQYGLPDLYELMENGEWTWDKLKEIAMAGNQDTDTDGTIDIYGFNARENLPWCFISSNGVNVVEQTASGLTMNLDNPAIVEALTALQDFTTTVDYKNSIDWSSEGWDSMITGFRDGNYMMCLEEYWISYGYLTSADSPMQDDWGWVPFPKGPSATDWSCYGKENGCRFMLNGIEDPATVALIYDLITDLADTDEEWDNLVEDKLEGWADDGQTVENVAYIYNNGLSNISILEGYTKIRDVVNSMFNEISSGASTPQTAIETYKSQIENEIADAANHDYNADMQDIVDAAAEAEEEADE